MKHFANACSNERETIQTKRSKNWDGTSSKLDRSDLSQRGGEDDETVARFLLRMLASVDGEPEELQVVTDGVRVTINEIEKAIQQLPQEQTLQTLRPLWSFFRQAA